MPATSNFIARRDTTVAALNDTNRSYLFVSYTQDPSVRESFAPVVEAKSYTGKYDLNDFISKVIMQSKYRPISFDAVNGAILLLLKRKSR